MVRETGFTSPLRLFSENPEEVLKRLRDGYIEYRGGATDQFTDGKASRSCSLRRFGVVWEELTVPINGCGGRQRDEQEADGYPYWALGTTNLALTARGIITSDEARSECKEDHRQIKGPQWELDECYSTKQVEILFHVLMVLLAYNVCPVYGQTQAGQRFAEKTQRARQRELRREGTQRRVVIAGPYYAVLEELDVADVLLDVEGAPRERLRSVVRRLKDARRAEKRAVG